MLIIELPMALTEREKEVLLETINFYNSTNRGFDEDKGMCVYETADGNHCAVGRCMNANGLAFGKHLVDSGRPSAVSSVHERSHSGIDYYLKPEYKGLSIEFWSSLQTLHDNMYCWDENGLSDLGKKYVSDTFNVTTEARHE